MNLGYEEQSANITGTLTRWKLISSKQTNKQKNKRFGELDSYLVAPGSIDSILMATSLSTMAAYIQPSHPNSNQQESGRDEKKKQGLNSHLLKKVPGSPISHCTSPKQHLRQGLTRAKEGGKEGERGKLSRSRFVSLRTVVVLEMVFDGAYSPQEKSIPFPFPIPTGRRGCWLLFYTSPRLINHRCLPRV